MGTPLTPSEAAELKRCFREHGRTLFGYGCYLTNGDRDLADDLVQDTFKETAQAWRALRSKRDEERLAWLRGTLRNLAVDEFRRNERAARKLRDIEERYRPREEDPVRDAIASTALERCWQVIGKMPQRQHLVAVMRWREDMAPAAIAAALCMSPSTVSVHLHNARQELRAELIGLGLFTETETEAQVRDPRKGGRRRGKQ